VADQFTLSGNYATDPLDGVISFDASVVATIDEALTLGKKNLQTISLGADSPEVVNFGDLAGANVVLLKAVGGKVRARFTSIDGTAQAIPFDSYLILMSLDAPITALDLTRTPATETTCRVFLGEKA